MIFEVHQNFIGVFNLCGHMLICKQAFYHFCHLSSATILMPTSIIIHTSHKKDKNTLIDTSYLNQNKIHLQQARIQAQNI